MKEESFRMAKTYRKKRNLTLGKQMSSMMMIGKEDEREQDSDSLNDRQSAREDLLDDIPSAKHWNERQEDPNATDLVNKIKEILTVGDKIPYINNRNHI